MSDRARRRLAETRTLLGWREAYKIAGLDTQGDPSFSDPKKNATKRRRLSRLINRQTSGAKELDSKQMQRVNRAYKYREKKGRFIDARVEREVKLINKTRKDARRQANRIFGPGGITPDARKLRARQRQNADLSEEDIRRIREAFENASQDEGRGIRKEYAQLLAKVKITALPPTARKDFSRRLKKAEDAVKRDEAKTRQTTLDV